MFPNEGKPYRAARNRLLRAEIALRRQVEKVAAMRRKLPAGGKLPQDYLFEEGEPARRVKLSELFGDRDTLFAKAERGQNNRHVDMLWPLWNLLDFTPEGRGRDWYPRLAYSPSEALKVSAAAGRPSR